ncbi:hypothetical protein BDF21DRAFT_415623 [Thamnidium elegans]|nr:hypothetical protein BDF21DRAFT_415623 [Thamnidium elegans]
MKSVYLSLNCFYFQLLFQQTLKSYSLAQILVWFSFQAPILPNFLLENIYLRFLKFYDLCPSFGLFLSFGLQPYIFYSHYMIYVPYGILILKLLEYPQLLFQHKP